ncbi:MAG: hypothetical protein AAGI63_12775, partial [Planctomycetota bacterium]
MGSSRIFMIKRSLAKHLATGVYVGDHFAFVDLDLVDQEKVNFASSLHPILQDFELLGDERPVESTERRLTIPISPIEKLSLPGVDVEAAHSPSLCLRSLTCDRDLYRQGSDETNVLVVDLGFAGSDVQIALLLGDSDSTQIEFEQRQVHLNKSGMAIVHFEDLPIGKYQVVRADLADDSDQCEFTVADFELAPLVATIGQVQIRNTSLSCTLRLAHFAKPLTGVLRVDLYNGPSRIDSRRTNAKQGLAIVGLEIVGEGPHHLEITLVDDASATASIPLPGSERKQREETTLNVSGTKTTASLLPGPGTTEALGLHVRQIEHNNSPIQITDPLNGHIRIQAMQDVEDCVACATALTDSIESTETSSVKYCVKRFGNLSAGDTVEIQSSDLAGLVSVGCFVNGNPWETRAFTLRRCDWQASIRIDDITVDKPLNAEEPRPSTPPENSLSKQFEPGKKVLVSVDIGGDLLGHAAIVIRDSRLQSSSRPAQKLAARIKAAADDTEPGEVQMQPVYGSRQQSRHYPHSWHFSPRIPHIENETLAKLVQRNLISDEQADHIMDSASENGKPYYALIVDNGYVEAEDLSRALAEIYGYDFVDVDSLSIDDSIIELCPESVARENSVIPIREDQNGHFVFAMSNPMDLETIEKLRFILNQLIEVVIGTPDAIFEAINHFYGQVEGEHADSMLQEFTDTAIAFTETDSAIYADTTISPHSAGRIERGSSDKIRCVNNDAHVIFCELIECSQGVGRAMIELPNNTGRYTAQAFVSTGRQWSETSVEFDVNSDPYVELQLPNVLFDGDQASGRVVARCESGKLSLEVLCNGSPVTLHIADPPYEQVETLELSVTDVEFGFLAGLGQYTAKVCDRVSGKSREDNHTVRPLGERIEPRRTLR